jgi:hypothetical protein
MPAERHNPAPRRRPTAAAPPAHGYWEPPAGALVEDHPPECANGHPLGPGQKAVAWKPCGCSTSTQHGHRTVTCNTCQDVWYWPPHTDDAQSVW